MSLENSIKKLTHVITKAKVGMTNINGQECECIKYAGNESICVTAKCPDGRICNLIWDDSGMRWNCMQITRKIM